MYQGERGGPGERGPMGQRGLPGERGVTGPAGTPEDKGDSGVKGDAGKHGPPGLIVSGIVLLHLQFEMLQNKKLLYNYSIYSTCHPSTKSLH